VIVFDPRDRTHVIGLNVLDCPRREGRGLVVSHVVVIFQKCGFPAVSLKIPQPAMLSQ
jgi:hypothetical protein